MASVSPSSRPQTIQRRSARGTALAALLLPLVGSPALAASPARPVMSFPTLPTRAEIASRISTLTKDYASGIHLLQVSRKIERVLVVRSSDFAIQSASGAMSRWIIGDQPELSPDGSLVAFWTGDGKASRIAVVSATDGTPIGSYPLPDGTAQPRGEADIWTPAALSWSADSKQLLASLDLPLPAGSPVTSPWLAPAADDIKPALHIYRSDDIVAEPLRDALLHEQVPNEYYERLDRSHVRSIIYALDIASGRFRQATHNPDSLVAPLALPDGRSIVAVRRDPSGNVRLDQARLVRIVSATGKIEAQSDRFTVSGHPLLSPDGRSVAFVGRQTGTGIMRAYAAQVEDLKFQEVGPDSAVTMNSNAGMQASISWLSSDHLLLLNAGPLEGVLVDAQVGGPSHIVSRRKACLRAIASGANGDIYLAESRPDTPGAVVRLANRNHPLQALFTAQASPLVGVTDVEYIDVSTPNRDDETIAAVLLRRRGLQVLPPLLVNPYPDVPAYRYGLDDGYGTTAFFLARGYAVLFVTLRLPQSPATAGQSQAFANKGIGAQAIPRLAADLDAVFKSIASRGLADTDRACGFGFSNGGGALVYYASASHGLKCMVLSAPALADFELSGMDPIARPDNSAIRQLIGGPSISRDPAFYAGLDVFHLAPRIGTPALITDGSLDEGLPPISRLFAALRSEGKDVSMILYPDQEHYPDLATRTDVIHRTLEYVDAHLRVR